ncbi:hypothetical protein [Paenibacillus durus]|uniref:PepSY domain-containing protein n=1 Tax=Paenibacillus durus ATCC 35681 TaxID=1333534 RepID=A0A0F7CGY3_PAEDU|nr:hypothetical protein [Paenibacillus durus]AKG33931.1 hypothetical protein VK70_04495 [Paenibacillus durus ATCC 35681]
MSELRKEVTEEEVKQIALQHIAQNPSNTFNYHFMSINKSINRYPCWSVIFETRTFNGDLVDGPLVLGIDEYGEIIFIG